MYGGTQSEMERLIKDAAALDSSVDASSMTFDNIVKAIHAVQTNLDITGTTAAEASETISGSAASMKSAWNNLLVSFVTGGDSFEQCLTNMVDTTKTFVKNALPVFKTAFKSIGNLIVDGIETVADNMPQISTAITNAVKNVFGTMGQVIPTVLPKVASGVATFVRGIADLIISNKTVIINSVAEMGTQIVKALYEGITGQEMSSDAFRSLKNDLQDIMNTVVKIGQFVVSNIKPIASIITGIVVVSAAWKAGWAAVNTVIKIQTGLQKAKNVVDAASSVTTKLMTKLSLKKAIATATETTATTGATAAQTALNLAMKACPVIAIITGVIALVAAFKKLNKMSLNYDKTLEKNNKKISIAVDNIKDLKTAVDNYSSSLSNADSLLSSKGNTISDIDTYMSDTETAITEIISTAMQENRQLRADELEDIRTYLDTLRAYEAEKLEIYQGQQQSVLNEAVLRFENGDVSTDEIANLIANGQDAMNNAVSALADYYTQQKTMLDNALAGGMSQTEYNEEMQALQEYANQQTQAAKEEFDSLLQVIAEYTSKMDSESRQAWETLSFIGSTWSSQASSIFGFFDKDRSTVTYSNWLGSLSDNTLTQANNFLSTLTMIKDNGGQISEEMVKQLETILSAFDNVPKDCQDAAMEIINGLIGGMESSIPGLESASTESASAIADVIREYFDINSPSELTKGMGVNIGEGLQIGLESTKTSITNSGKSVVTGLIKGMKSKQQEAVNAARAIATAINAEFDKIQDINSPSKVWEEKGQYLVEGLNIGLEKGSADTKEVYKKEPILPSYGNENSAVSRSYTRQNVTYSAPINITVNGDGSSRQTARSVKNAVKEGINEMMKSFANSNKAVREI